MTKKVWNIDANLRNADWLKTTTWDLPTDKTAFIAHLASINKTVTEFMALPAAEAMPDTLKRDLAPDQLDDIHRALEGLTGVLGSGTKSLEFKVRHVRDPSAWPGNPPVGTPLPLPASFTSPSAPKPARSVRKPASARYAEYPSARFAEIQNRVEDLQTQIEEIEEAHDPEWNSFSDAVTKRGRALQKQQDKLRDEEQKKREDFYKAVFGVIDRTDSASGKNTPAYDAGRDLYVVNDGATLKRNRALRAGRSPSPAVIKIDKMIAESTVKQNVMLYRMAVLSPDSIRKLRVGAVMRDRAFQSTGLAVSDAMAYADVRLEQSNERGKKVVLFNMRVPKGSNAVDVGYGEVVLPRNTEMKIIGIRREKITHYGDIYNTVIVDVEVTTP